MKIAFFGTSNRSKPILEALKASDFDLTLCATKQDVKVGRKQELTPTGVKQWAQDNRVHFVTVDSLKPMLVERVLTELKINGVDLIVAADFSFIVPQKIFDLPKYKTVNIHFSLLPNYRGACPVQFAILNGDKKIGITYQLVSKGMDEGDIIFQSEYPLTGRETTEELYATLFEKAAKELPQVLTDYTAGKLKPKQQDHTKATYTYSKTKPKSTQIAKEDAKIDWKSSPKQIDQMVRAFNPWPIAWTTLGELSKSFSPVQQGKDLSLKVRIYETKLENGNLKIVRLQVEGKSILTWNEFENGYLA